MPAQKIQLTKAQLKSISSLQKKGLNLEAIANQFGVSRRTLSRRLAEVRG